MKIETKTTLKIKNYNNPKVQYNAWQYSVVHCIQHCVVLDSEVQQSTAQCCIVQYRIVQCCIILCDKVQYCYAIQYNAVYCGVILPKWYNPVVNSSVQCTILGRINVQQCSVAVWQSTVLYSTVQHDSTFNNPNNATSNIKTICCHNKPYCKAYASASCGRASPAPNASL